MTCCLLSLLMFLAIIANNMDLRGEQSDHGSYCFAVMKKTSLKCTTVKRVLSGHSKRRKTYFQDRLSLNAGQKYCRMLQGDHSAILWTFIKLPFVIKIFVMSIFEWPLKTGFTVYMQHT